MSKLATRKQPLVDGGSGSSLCENVSHDSIDWIK